jgi:hypothetical protein
MRVEMEMIIARNIFGYFEAFSLQNDSLRSGGFSVSL